MLKISFNSYKGGACRTTTCLNTLPYLAKRLGATSKQPIIVFDVDLESKGLTSLFTDKKENNKQKKAYSARNLFIEERNGVNDRVENYAFLTVEDGDWYFQHFIKVGNYLGLEDNGSVLFCGVDPNADVISDTEFKTMKDKGLSPIEKLMDMLEGMDDKPKAVIFDCAAGNQLSTLAVFPVVDRAVVCMRPTTQFRIGTSEYLKSSICNKFNEATERTREVVLLPTAVAPINVSNDEPRHDEIESELKRLKEKAYYLIDRDIIDDVLNTRYVKYKLNYSMVADEDDVITGIPEIQRFKWTEDNLLYGLPNKSNEELLLEKRYDMLAEILAKEI